MLHLTLRAGQWADVHANGEVCRVLVREVRGGKLWLTFDAPEAFVIRRSGSKRFLWKTEEHRCAYCGCELTYELATVDHLTPLSKVGKEHPSNECLSCLACNQSKGDLWFDDLAEVREWVFARKISLIAQER